MMLLLLLLLLLVIQSSLLQSCYFLQMSTSCSGDSKSSKSPCTVLTSPQMPLRNSSVDCKQQEQYLALEHLKHMPHLPQPASYGQRQAVKLGPATAHLAAEIASAQDLVYLAGL